ncbi:MAG TPA: two-component system response regulator [Cyanobacteria bacterium UBA8803]|nr:two-component system response regulator [Cyanobacteria bacterium UBA9273]HBL57446.1 two-component system response regulator [Cyanobacteria bacterium UBA8803]
MKQILVVDDSATMRRMVMASLRALKNVNFKEASNGLEAIEQLVMAPVDLMILDLNMPEMHGLEVLQFVRAHPKFTAIPIMVLTTRGDESSKASAIAAGASSYLTKPFEPRSFAAKAQEFLDCITPN